ncbi:L-fucose/L-arabinose isomerase family protein [Anaerotruncus rubiinfantis]|uniref:L-fucose/L-arabinose isomerase family protein n=1 Tax=Anaerotruncus rubiinfantis TaxID=1720200 RepID=UPI00082F73B2|nr:L-fucose/L-arabinose isomerase family protein [Anaerotruncus rubiinfantis]
MLERFQKRYHIRLGLAPTRRANFSETAFRLDRAQQHKQAIEEKLRRMGVDFVNLDFLNEEGLIYAGRDAEAAARYFKEQQIDALFIPHVNFGCEEAVCRLADLVDKPVLLWAPRDEAPQPDGYRFRDAQCGLFATSKVLSRFGVKFTYITNCWIDDPAFEKGMRTFLSAAGVVKAMNRPRIGQISVRPNAFWSVKCNEGELLERFGVQVVPITLVELQERFQNLFSAKGPEFEEELARIRGKINRIDVEKEYLDKMCSMKLAIWQWAEEEGLSAAATQCWAPFTAISDIAPCYMMGDSTDDGFPVICECDLHGALTATMALGANGGSEPPFFADLTIRHPENDNAELLWHCGVFPPSLVGEKGVTLGCHQGKGYKCAGQFELKSGDLTITRFDAVNGEYKLLMGEGRTTIGPYSRGSYVWAEFDDWKKWEHKFIYGPYIHHCTGLYGSYAAALYEACKYFPGGITPDPVTPDEDTIHRILRG